MAQTVEKKIGKLVLDTSAFIKAVRIETLADSLYTVPEVISEVRDSKARSFLDSFLFPIIKKDPPREHIRIVTEFSKKTGDYASLSATDLKVLALTYTLELETHGSVDHLRSEPEEIRFEENKPNHNILNPPGKTQQQNTREEIEIGNKGEIKVDNKGEIKVDNKEETKVDNKEEIKVDNNEEIKVDNKEETKVDKNQEIKIDSKEETKVENKEEIKVENKGETKVDNKEEIKVDNKEEMKEEAKTETNESQDLSDKKENEKEAVTEEIEKNEEEQDEISEDENKSLGFGYFTSENDDEGWITPSNIQQYNDSQKVIQGQVKLDQKLPVALLTTDFAIQNVLLQMKMNLTTVEGLAIKYLHMWILKCYGCSRICKETWRQFCPFCGNYSTLRKVSYSIDSDGNTHLHEPKRAPSLRGTIFPMPLPKGGRQKNELIFSESQLPRRRPQKKRIDLNDTSTLMADRSRPPAKKVVIGYGKRNPNEAKRKIGKKNKPKKRQI